MWFARNVAQRLEIMDCRLEAGSTSLTVRQLNRVYLPNAPIPWLRPRPLIAVNGQQGAVDEFESGGE